MMPTTLRLKSNQEISQKQTMQKSQQNFPSSLRPKNIAQQQFDEEDENDLERQIERNIAQQTSRQIEGIGGALGDVNSIIEGFTGLPFLGVLGHFSPTSSKLREKSETLSGGYTKPKNEFEESVGQIQQDISSFMIPGSKEYSMMRNIGIPVVANLAKEGLKLTGSEKLGEAAKVGSMIVLDILSQRQGGAKKFINSLFREQEKRIPEGLSYNAKDLQSNLESLTKYFELGGDKPSTTKALSKLKEIFARIKNGKINLKEAAAFRPAINEMIDDMQGFEYIFKPKLKKKIIGNLQQVKSNVITSLEDYGKHFDPEFLKLSRTANEANAAFEKSNKISQFLNKHFGAKALSKPVQFLLGLAGPGLGALKAGALTTGAIGGSLGLAYQGVKMISRLKNSPTLRKYYSSILQAAARGNVGQASRGVKAIEKEMKKEEIQR